MKRLFLLIFIIATSWTMVVSQNIQIDKNASVQKTIEQAIENGARFSPCELIKDIALSADRSRQWMNISQAQLDFIQTSSPSHLEFDIPMSAGHAFELLLVENDLFVDGFLIMDGLGQPLGDEFELGTHYSGIVEGQPGSLVAMSVFDHGISGFVKSNDAFWLIRTEINATGDAKSFMFEYELQDRPPSCYTPDDGYVYTEEELRSRVYARSGGTVNIYVEVDNDIYKNKGAGASSFTTGLFNESQTLYANDGVSIQMSEMVIWTSRSPYKGNDASRLLSGFQKHHGSGGTWNGDLAHLISYRGGGGIAAGFAGLCSGDRRQSMCFSGVNNSYSSVPTYSWSVMVFTHEMGHLLGSRHTHACVWNGNGTAIDGCYSTEGTCERPGIPENGGTIMSYCHLTSAGINFLNGFGPQPQTVILNNIANAACLGGVVTDHCINGIQDADETGVDCGGVDCPSCPSTSCDAPTGLYASNIKGNRAKLNWDAVASAISYDVQVREQGGVYTPQNTFNTGSNTLSLRGFSVGAAYEWHVQANCSGSSSIYTTDCSFTAGDQNSGACGTTLISGLDEYSIYPNPAFNEITLVGIPNDGTTAITIFDLSGQIVKAQLMVTNNTVNIGTLNRGLYIMRIKTPDRSSALKFQIQ